MQVKVYAFGPTFAFSYDKTLVGLVDGDKVYLVGLAMPVFADNVYSPVSVYFLAEVAFGDEPRESVVVGLDHAPAVVGR